MTVSEIIIAVCLGIGPLLVGNLLGRIASALYGCRNRWIARTDFQLLHRLYIEDDRVLERRQWIMRLCWTAIGAAIGGFASGVYVQHVLDVVSYIQ